MRLIDADAAYKAACEGADTWDGGCSPYRDDCIREEMDKVPTASPWHRVEEELPEIGKRVLVSYGGYVQILKRTDGMTSNGRNYWWNEADGLWEQVEKGSYWMPIEPPKEEE